MACFHPIQAWRGRSKTGQIDGPVFFHDAPDSVSLVLPCGRCIGCRIERAQQWSTRILHEAASYPVNSFVTLTYDDCHLPPGGSLQYSDVQKFVRALRRARAQKVGKSRRVYSVLRYFVCGEYGDQLSRPHYHAILFNVGFPDARPLTQRLTRSAELERLWPHGFSSIGQVTKQSAMYVAKYSLKKVVGSRAIDHYSRVDPETGVIYSVQPEFARMSLKPGIGSAWFDRYYESDVEHRDSVVVDGYVNKTPKYYDRLAKRRDALRFENLLPGRLAKALDQAPETTPERLQAREIVLRAKTQQTKRKI